MPARGRGINLSQQKTVFPRYLEFSIATNCNPCWYPIGDANRPHRGPKWIRSFTPAQSVSSWVWDRGELRWLYASRTRRNLRTRARSARGRGSSVYIYICAIELSV